LLRQSPGNCASAERALAPHRNLLHRIAVLDIEGRVGASMMALVPSGSHRRNIHSRKQFSHLSCRLLEYNGR